MTGSTRPIDHPAEGSSDPRPDGDASVRLSFRPDGAPPGEIDGVWWPRSDALNDEAPGLLAVLTERIGPVERLSYDLADWAVSDRRLLTGGRRIRLDGFRRRRPAGTVHAVGTRRAVVSLLVIPASTPPDQAAEMLRRAADPTATLASVPRQRVGDAGEPVGGTASQPVVGGPVTA